MKPVILEGVSKWYGNVIGLNDVTLEIEEGVTGLLGPNGAGKSTMLKVITGQIKHSKGNVKVFGNSVWNNATTLANIGYSPEGDSFYSWITGREFVEMAASLHGLNDPVKEAGKVIDFVEMTDDADRKIKTYSKGMRQRIKIAQALVGKPKLLVLDEPLSGTDPLGRVQMLNLIEKLEKEGTSIIVSSHVLHEIERMTDQITLINHGKLIAEGNIHILGHIYRVRHFIRGSHTNSP